MKMPQVDRFILEMQYGWPFLVALALFVGVLTLAYKALSRY
jgi:hypothetical protein